MRNPMDRWLAFDRLIRWACQIELLTKGDNNRVDDRGLYAPGQMWLNREDILGGSLHSD